MDTHSNDFADDMKLDATDERMPELRAEDSEDAQHVSDSTPDAADDMMSANPRDQDDTDSGEDDISVDEEDDPMPDLSPVDADDLPDFLDHVGLPQGTPTDF
jgi:hypothetical protein